MARTWGDEDGMFWTTPVKVGRTALGGNTERGPRQPVEFRMPAAPSGYVLPSVFPRFRYAKRITFDTETHDPDLKSLGPGVRRDGFIVGFSLKVEDQKGEYYPVRHKGGPNLDPAQMFGWLKEEMSTFRGELIGAHLLYDMDYSEQEGVKAPFAQWRDVQIAQPLLNENQRRYSLEHLAQQHLGTGKVESEMDRLYGEGWKKRMLHTHPGHVAPYAIGDVDLPEAILAKQKPLLLQEGLLNLFHMECRLLPMLLYMRRLGMRVDVERAGRFEEELAAKQKVLLDEIERRTGRRLSDTCHTSEVAALFDKQGIAYPLTHKGNATIVNEWLKAHPDPLCDLIVAARKIEKFKGTFVTGYIQDYEINGRLHAQFHPMRGDEFGTVSGRFSSSHPNLQNIPARDDELAPLVRQMFLPDEGMELWSRDYSQIEYRFLVHFAVLAKCIGALEAAQRYRDDPTTDFHVIAAELTGKPRKQAKNINFGVVYGMGKETMASNLGCSVAEADPILREFHARMPFMKSLYDMAANRAKDLGYVKTILGRKRRFDLFEPTKWGLKKRDDPALPLEAAQEKWGNVRRAFTHKSLNGVLQGSAADLIKKAMVDAWDAGLFGEGKPLRCHLTVHDELVGSKDKSKEATEAMRELDNIMTHAIPLKVPVLVSGSSGGNWDEAK